MKTLEYPNIYSYSAPFLNTVGVNFKDIAESPKLRGLPDYRNIRKRFTKKPNAPVISKSSKNDNIEISIKMPFGKSRIFAKTAFNVNKFDEKILMAKITTLYEKINANTGQNLQQLE